jgi:hypothetical protein
MFGWNRNRLLIIIALVLIVSIAAAARSRKMQRVSEGVWGGPHANMQVGPTSATIEYDCANGTIAGPLSLDSKGHFSWRGTHNQEHHGPIRRDETSDAMAVIYTGSIKGDTMTMTIKKADSKETIETYTLKRGVSGRIHKCM